MGNLREGSVEAFMGIGLMNALPLADFIVEGFCQSLQLIGFSALCWRFYRGSFPISRVDRLFHVSDRCFEKEENMRFSMVWWLYDKEFVHDRNARQYRSIFSSVGSFQMGPRRESPVCHRFPSIAVLPKTPGSSLSNGLRLHRWLPLIFYERS